MTVLLPTLVTSRISPLSKQSWEKMRIFKLWSPTIATTEELRRKRTQLTFDPTITSPSASQVNQKIYVHVCTVFRKRGEVSFEPEIEKDVLHLVMSLGQRKNSEFPREIEPQTFRFHICMLYHWATGTLWCPRDSMVPQAHEPQGLYGAPGPWATGTLWWARSIAKFILDTRPAYC